MSVQIEIIAWPRLSCAEDLDLCVFRRSLMPESIESQAILQLTDITRVLVCQARTDFASTVPRFLAFSQLTGETTEV